MKTSLSTVCLEKEMFAELVNKLRVQQYFMEPGYLLSFSQESISCPYPELTENSPHIHPHT